MRPGDRVLYESIAKATAVLGGFGASVDEFESWSSDDWTTDDAPFTDAEELRVSLPDAADDVSMSVAQLLALADESESLTVANAGFDGVATGLRWLLVLDEPAGLFEHVNAISDAPVWPARHAVATLAHDRQALSIGLVRGFTPYALYRAKFVDTDKYNPPWSPSDWFVEILAPASELREEVAIEAARAYLFSLSSKMNDLVLQLRPRSHFPTEGPEESLGERIVRAVDSLPESVAAPKSGPGYGELCGLYLAAQGASDPELQVFLAHKVFEYVQPTVLKLNAHKEIRARLTEPEAQRATARFIEELEALVKRHQRKSDTAIDALKAVVLECCDPPMLAPYAPRSMTQLKRAASSDASERRTAALAEFAKRLGATRDAFAHAKSNYSPKGGECPDEDLADFAQCVLKAAAQVVRWFARVPDGSRVVRLKEDDGTGRTP